MENHEKSLQVQSPCPNKKVCGSCSWSEISYEDQLKRKLREINESFAKNDLNLECSKIIPSPKIAHYRNRMDFVINFEGKVGLREKGRWWRVLDDHACFLGMEKIEEVFHKSREWIQNSGLSYFDRKSFEGFLRYIVLRAAKKGKIMANVVTSSSENGISDSQIEEKFRELAEITGVNTLVWSKNHTTTDVSFGSELKVITGDGFITEEIGGFKFVITPNAFFQTNPFCAEKLVEIVQDFSSRVDSRGFFLDLYCGSGFFTLPVGVGFEKVLGIELVEDAIVDAKRNLEINAEKLGDPAGKFEFKISPVEKMSWVGESGGFSEVPNLILVDPPRSGLHKDVVEEILKSTPRYIIYVSCNYKRFAEEMKLIKEKYEVLDTKAIDMFPHTPHVELVSLLKLVG